MNDYKGHGLPNAGEVQMIENNLYAVLASPQGKCAIPAPEGCSVESIFCAFIGTNICTKLSCSERIYVLLKLYAAEEASDKITACTRKLQLPKKENTACERQS